MLQLSGTLRNASVRLTPLSSWRVPTQQLIAACSGAANPSLVLAQAKKEDPPARKSKKQNNAAISSKNPLVQAVFNTLKSAKFGPVAHAKDNIVTSKIKVASSLEALLNIANEKQLTRDNAFSVVTILINWVNSGKAKLSDFELDNRFLHLCALLSQPTLTQARSIENEGKAKKYIDDLYLFYGMNEISEATKEVANITVKQMIRVMSALANQKRRTTPLLRSLSFNISRSPEPLNIKQISDLLYSMAILNYPDEVLLQKVCSDLMLTLNNIEKSIIPGSILTSLGLLRYKNEQILDELSDWMIAHPKGLRTQDLCSLLLTLAMIGYTPANVQALNEVLIKPLKETEMTKPTEWLDIVWALTVLQLAEDRHIASVLDNEFIRKLEDTSQIPIPKRTKLLNINGAAMYLLKEYKGPILESDSSVFKAPIHKSKEKELFVKSLTGTLEHMFPIPEYLKINIDSQAGFQIDAEFCVNRDGNRLPLSSKVDGTKGVRIAVLAQYYHDFCRGKQDPLGFHDLFWRILEARGYTVLMIPHTEFRAEDKTVQRISYIKGRIKAIVK